MKLNPQLPGEIRNHLSAWIDTLAPNGLCGVRMDGPTTCDLIALLVACRACLDTPPVIIDLAPSDFSIRGKT